jgi:hypothetical protein
LSGVIFIVCVLAGCQARQTRPISAPVTTDEIGGMNLNETYTLNSLERVDDYPLYVMHYKGEYSTNRSQLPTQGSSTVWSCSLFAALGDEAYMLYGRNFDWTFSPALLLFTDPPDGYASVSMVDIDYLGFHSVNENPVDMPLTQQRALLQAPFLPFDGMNEYGLAIGMAAVPESALPYDSKKPTIGSLVIIREILDHARTVDEATTIMAKYNLDFGSSPYLHYLIADASGNDNHPGKSVLVEFYNGKMEIIPNENPWHLATNFLRISTRGDGGCLRYAHIRQQLTNRNGKMTPIDAMQLLEDESQTGDYPTQWSVIYEISTGEIDIVMGHEYGQRYTFQLPLTGK